LRGRVLMAHYQLWLAAASAAPGRRDADKARYRAAASLARAGRGPDAAGLFDELAADPDGERAARAAFERAELELDAGHAEAGAALRDRALRAFPDSGVARRALGRQLGWHVERGGAPAALAYLNALAVELGGSELAEAIAYQRAVHLALAGSREAALAAFLEVARRFPYPVGVYWDDALFRAAELEVELGRPRQALTHLERMLAEREARPIAGSLERPRFGPARFLIAEILRDELGDPAGARREFLRLVDEHPTSRLRDDALWAAATLGVSLGDREGACREGVDLIVTSSCVASSRGGA
ncbi:MAG TPA: tetratricopeptide repeat protein, partial [Thermoanaerobaculales bacterium]|nr:tetratricopeptide repeat protein [Thermoanaerobaculales bacterium]